MKNKIITGLILLVMLVTLFTACNDDYVSGNSSDPGNSSDSGNSYQYVDLQYIIDELLGGQFYCPVSSNWYAYNSTTGDDVECFISNDIDNWSKVEYYSIVKKYRNNKNYEFIRMDSLDSLLVATFVNLKTETVLCIYYSSNSNLFFFVSGSDNIQRSFYLSMARNNVITKIDEMFDDKFLYPDLCQPCRWESYDSTALYEFGAYVGFEVLGEESEDEAKLFAKEMDFSGYYEQYIQEYKNSDYFETVSETSDRFVTKYKRTGAVITVISNNEYSFEVKIKRR